jgi:hypothetical protein
MRTKSCPSPLQGAGCPGKTPGPLGMGVRAPALPGRRLHAVGLRRSVCAYSKTKYKKKIREEFEPVTGQNSTDTHDDVSDDKLLSESNLWSINDKELHAPPSMSSELQVPTDLGVIGSVVISLRRGIARKRLRTVLRAVLAMVHWRRLLASRSTGPNALPYLIPAPDTSTRTNKRWKFNTSGGRGDFDDIAQVEDTIMDNQKPTLHPRVSPRLSSAEVGSCGSSPCSSRGSSPSSSPGSSYRRLSPASSRGSSPSSSPGAKHRYLGSPNRRKIVKKHSMTRSTSDPGPIFDLDNTPPTKARSFQSRSSTPTNSARPTSSDFASLGVHLTLDASRKSPYEPCAVRRSQEGSLHVCRGQVPVWDPS